MFNLETFLCNNYFIWLQAPQLPWTSGKVESTQTCWLNQNIDALLLFTFRNFYFKYIDTGLVLILNKLVIVWYELILDCPNLNYVSKTC